MKKFATLIAFAFIAIQMMAGQLVLIKTQNFEACKSLFERKELQIHLYSDHYAIATLNGSTDISYELIADNAWSKSDEYLMVWLPKADRDAYIAKVSQHAQEWILTDQFMVAGFNQKDLQNIRPKVHGGLVRIPRGLARLPKVQLPRVITEDTLITNLLPLVDSVNIRNTIQQLQDYGTRDCYEPTSVDAQNWLKEQFENLGLNVELQDFPMYNGESSDNVIATLTGVESPEEYVICGGHFDSINWYGDAPGADDNASGTASVLEVARILSQEEFGKTLVFIAFSGEEYGLYGSGAYAERAAQEGMNILGYFNMDMVSYLHPGQTIHTDMIAPASAQPLVDFYTEVTGIYLDNFEIQPATFTGGDSDHTSFNNNGFMGIFPFEDTENYSPYIHSEDDILDLSANSMTMARTFAQATLACMATMGEIKHTVGMEKQNLETHFKLFPNPANGQVQFENNSQQPVQITINNLAGQVVYSAQAGKSGQIDLSNMAPGLYSVKVQNQNSHFSQKLMVQ